MKYRKKAPLEIEAIQWTGKKSLDAVTEFLSGYDPLFHNPMDSDGFITIDTTDGLLSFRMRDWIIKFGDELYSCDQEDFAATYEPVEG